MFVHEIDYLGKVTLYCVTMVMLSVPNLRVGVWRRCSHLRAGGDCGARAAVCNIPGHTDSPASATFLPREGGPHPGQNQRQKPAVQEKPAGHRW